MHRFTNTVKTGLLLALVSAVLACSPSTPTLVKYELDGVSFTHYSDWTITSDIIINTTGSRNITIEGPNDALVSIVLLPTVTQLALEKFANDIAEARVVEIRKTLSIASFHPAKVNSGSSQVVSGEVGGKKQNGILQRFNIPLFGHEIPHEARFFSVSAQPSTAFIMTQVAIEDARKVEAGFAVTLRTIQLGKAK